MTEIGQLQIEKAGELFDYAFVKEKVQLLPYDFVKNRRALPLEKRESTLLVAVSDPLAFETLEEIRLKLGYEVLDLLTTDELLDAAIDATYRSTDDAASELFHSLAEQAEGDPVEETGEGYDLLAQKNSDSPVIRMLNILLTEAINQGASDIHFEPLESSLAVRYRIDGVLQLRHTPPKEFQSQLLTRIKVMARLDIAEQRLPQDGRIKLKMGAKQIDFRVSTIPVVYGERIVLRILDKSNVIVGLNKMGMTKKTLESFKSLISISEGIVLVTGPTGSGKTTTLYSALSQINSDPINIMTIEDPVEYKLQGMAQIAVNPKIDLTFSTGLRHILRQDPDVIMIGEIRDKETAEIAIQSALTGHLVLSTLHTNDAPSALTRMVDMGVEPYLLASTVVGILAQRLVRCICQSCKVSYKPTAVECRHLAIDSETDVLYKGEGCEHCFGTGYKGRCGIFELMPVTRALKRKLIETADSNQLLSQALEDGMEPLRQCGGALVRQGITSTAEVLRVTRGAGN